MTKTLRCLPSPVHNLTDAFYLNEPQHAGLMELRRQRKPSEGLGVPLEHLELNQTGIPKSGIVYRNLEPAALVEHALRRNEGMLSRRGALVVNTGKRTGRSADDKFIVDSPSVHDQIAWGKVNRPISQGVFDALYERVRDYLTGSELFVFDGFAGASPTYTKRFRIVNELASQNLFIHQLLLRPTEEQLIDFVPDYTVLAAPGFECLPERDGTPSEAAIMIDYDNHRALIAGTQYSGEIKKAVLSIMNYIMPQENVLPMHCAANVGEAGDTAVFFGLSGTGKTTLSADPHRRLIGDDEHGWAGNEVFNFEGGCYAKCINLSPEHEPDIYNAIRFGALTENVVMDPVTRELDFDDDSLTANSRVGYPIDYINNIEPCGFAEAPQAVIFLTADAFGVLPPVSKLNPDQAIYYFLSGFTSKLAGTEIGVKDPVPTFSTCFGEPFLPLDPMRYAFMLKERVQATNAKVYLVNTGWNGTGQRMPLKYTRAMITAALAGSFDAVEFVTDPYFGLAVPTSCPGCPDELMIPEHTWQDKKAYDAAARKLAAMFRTNFEEKYAHASEKVKSAGPLV